MNYTTTSLGDGISLISVQEPKFKTNTLAVQLLVPIVPEKNAAYSLAFAMLSASCRRYPDNIAMTVCLDDLYGGTLGTSTGANGTVMTLMMYGSVIADRFALQGEPLLDGMTDLLLECLFEPNAENGAFNASEFAIQKKELLDTIQAEINNKRGYAMTRAAQTIFEAEPDAYPSYGVREDAEALTPENVFAAYQELLRISTIRIYFVGPEPVPALEPRLREAFSVLTDRAPLPLVFKSASRIKPETARITEPMDVVQSKLVMAFKYEEQDSYAVRMFNVMFGAAPYSMLFMNVREKQSLCYYCVSRARSLRNTVIVDSGVELANAERTHAAVLEQLEAFRRGEFPDELLENAKRSMADALHGIGDSPFSCIMEAYERFYSGDDREPEERIRRFMEVTREDVIAVAQALREDTVYLMQQEEGTEHEEH